MSYSHPCKTIDADESRPLALWSRDGVEVVATVKRGELELVTVCGRAADHPTDAIEVLDCARLEREIWVDLAEELDAYETLYNYWDALA